MATWKIKSIRSLMYMCRFIQKVQQRSSWFLVKSGVLHKYIFLLTYKLFSVTLQPFCADKWINFCTKNSIRKSVFKWHFYSTVYLYKRVVLKWQDDKKKKKKTAFQLVREKNQSKLSKATESDRREWQHWDVPHRFVQVFLIKSLSPLR